MHKQTALVFLLLVVASFLQAASIFATLKNVPQDKQDQLYSFLKKHGIDVLDKSLTMIVNEQEAAFLAKELGEQFVVLLDKNRSAMEQQVSEADLRIVQKYFAGIDTVPAGYKDIKTINDLLIQYSALFPNLAQVIDIAKTYVSFLCHNVTCARVPVQQLKVDPFLQSKSVPMSLFTKTSPIF